jgi:hypothetical protein
MIRYKDALTLIQVNKDINSDGSPMRSDKGFWILQIPQRRDNSTKKLDANFDTKSTLSGVSAYTDISIDPVIRMKAEKILEY